MLIIAASILFILAYNLHIYPWMMDDAFIFFRYAENFASGEGFVYNPGERVEGCTSFLWMLILSVAALFKADLPSFSKFFNAAAAFGVIWLTAGAHRYVRALSPAASAAAAALTAVCGAFAPWVSSGMEPVLFSFLILAACFYSAGAREPVEYGVSGALCALVMLCRPEGVFLAAPVIAFHLMKDNNPRKAGFAASLFKFCLIYVPYFVWRWAYYGSFAPNTFHAKVGFGLAQAVRGIKYFCDYLAAAAPLVFFAAAAGYYIFGRPPETRYGPPDGVSRSGREGLAVLYIFVVLNVLFVIAAGGDFMYGFRFFAHLTAPLALLSAFALESFFRDGPGRFAAAVALALCFSASQFFIHPEIYGISDSSPVDFGREAGRFLRSQARPDALLAINAAGIIPYYSKLRTIDMLGLTDAHIGASLAENFGAGPAGHEKGDGAYVMRRKPDFIVFGNFEGSKKPVYRSDREIFAMPEFAASYEPKTRGITVRGPRGGEEERYFHYYVRKKGRLEPPSPGM